MEGNADEKSLVQNVSSQNQIGNVLNDSENLENSSSNIYNQVATGGPAAIGFSSANEVGQVSVISPTNGIEKAIAAIAASGGDGSGEQPPPENGGRKSQNSAAF